MDLKTELIPPRELVHEYIQIRHQLPGEFIANLQPDAREDYAAFMFREGPLTEQLAIEFERILKRPKHFWMSLEQRYREKLAGTVELHSTKNAEIVLAEKKKARVMRFRRSFSWDPLIHNEAWFSPMYWNEQHPGSMVRVDGDLILAGVDAVAAALGLIVACPDLLFHMKTAALMSEWEAKLRRIEEQDGGLPDPDNTPGRLHSVYSALQVEVAVLGDFGPLHSKYCGDPQGPWPLPNLKIAFFSPR